MAKSRRVKKRGGHKSNVDEDPGPDISLLSRPSATSVKGLRDVLKAFEEGTPEVNHLLSNECEIIYECRVCRSLYRSFLNFITHKRIYCQQQYTSGSPKASHFFNDVLDEDETVVVHDETVRATRHNNPGTDTATSMEVDYGPSCSSKPKAVPRKNLTEILGMLSQKASGFEGLKRIVNLDGFAELGNDSASAGFKGRLPRQHLLHLESMESTDVAIRQTVTLGPDGKILPTAAAVNNASDDDDETSSQNPESRNKQDEMETNLLCSKCNIRFSSRKTFKHHMNSVHDPSRVSYVCPCCRSKFANSWSVHRHLKSVHNKTNEQLRKLRDQIQKVVRRKSSDTESTSKKPPAKQLSPKECASNEQHKTYMKRCSEMEVFEKEYQKCSGCSRKFDRSAAFNYHVQTCALRMAALKNIKCPPSSASQRASNSSRNAPVQSSLAKQPTAQSTDSDSFLSKAKSSSRNTVTPLIESTSGSASSSSTDLEDQAMTTPSAAVLAGLQPRERHNSDKRPDYLATKKIEIQLRRDYNKIAVVPTQPDVVEVCSSPVIDSNSRSRIDYNKILPGLPNSNTFLNANAPASNQGDGTDDNEDVPSTSNGCLSVAISEPQKDEKIYEMSNDSSAASASVPRYDKEGLSDSLSYNDNLLTIFSTSKENETIDTNSNDSSGAVPHIFTERSNLISRSNSRLSSSHEVSSDIVKDDETNNCIAVNPSGQVSSKSSRRNSLSNEDVGLTPVKDMTNDINSNDSFVHDPKVLSRRSSIKTSRRNSLSVDEDLSAIIEDVSGDSILGKPKIRSERLINKAVQKSVSNSTALTAGLEVANKEVEGEDPFPVKASVRSVRSRINVKKNLGNEPNETIIDNVEGRGTKPALRKVRSVQRCSPKQSNLVDKTVPSTSRVNEMGNIPNRSVNKLRSKLDKIRRGNRLLHSASLRTSKRQVSSPIVDKKPNSVINGRCVGKTNSHVGQRMKFDSKVRRVTKQPPLAGDVDKPACDEVLSLDDVQSTNKLSGVNPSGTRNIISLVADINDVNSDVAGQKLENAVVDSKEISVEANNAAVKEEEFCVPKSILECILTHEKNENSELISTDQKLSNSNVPVDCNVDKRKKVVAVVKRASIMEWNGFEEQHVSAIYGLEQKKKRFKGYDGGEISPSLGTATVIPAHNDTTMEEEYRVPDLVHTGTSVSTIPIKDEEEITPNSSKTVPEPLATDTSLQLNELLLNQDKKLVVSSSKLFDTGTEVTEEERPASEASEQGWLDPKLHRFPSSKK